MSGSQSILHHGQMADPPFRHQMVQTPLSDVSTTFRIIAVIRNHLILSVFPIKTQCLVWLSAITAIRISLSLGFS